MMYIGIGDGRGAQFLEINDDGTVAIVDDAKQRIVLSNPRGLLEVLQESFEKGRIP